MNEWNPYGDILLQAEEAMEARESAEKSLCIKFHETFSTDAGKVVLEYLKAKTLNQPSIPNGMSFFESISHGHRREGSNDVVREIINRINKAIEE